MKSEGILSKFLNWLEAEEAEKPEVPHDPERALFMEYLEYLEIHEHVEFHKFLQLRGAQKRVRLPAQTHSQSTREADFRQQEEQEAIPTGLGRQLALYRLSAGVVAVVVIGALALVALNLPTFGDPEAPALNAVSRRYLEQGLEETGAVNAVAGLILDYRAFDTFGESTVLFAAAICVNLLLRRKSPPRDEARPDLILRWTGQLLLPLILLFGVYVVLNGHLGPGGGFSGGAALGGGLVLCALILGRGRMDALLPPERISRLTSAGLLAYAAMKGYSFFTGANHVGWEIPKGRPGALISAGFILPLNLCVGLVVACTIYAFFALFSQLEQED